MTEGTPLTDFGCSAEESLIVQETSSLANRTVSKCEPGSVVVERIIVRPKNSKRQESKRKTNNPVKQELINGGNGQDKEGVQPGSIHDDVTDEFFDALDGMDDMIIDEWYETMEIVKDTATPAFTPAQLMNKCIISLQSTLMERFCETQIDVIKQQEVKERETVETLFYQHQPDPGMHVRPKPTKQTKEQQVQCQLEFELTDAKNQWKRVPTKPQVVAELVQTDKSYFESNHKAQQASDKATKKVGKFLTGLDIIQAETNDSGEWEDLERFDFVVRELEKILGKKAMKKIMDVPIQEGRGKFKRNMQGFAASNKRKPRINMSHIRVLKVRNSDGSYMARYLDTVTGQYFEVSWDERHEAMLDDAERHFNNEAYDFYWENDEGLDDLYTHDEDLMRSRYDLEKQCMIAYLDSLYEDRDHFAGLSEKERFELFNEKVREFDQLEETKARRKGYRNQQNAMTYTSRYDQLQVLKELISKNARLKTYVKALSPLERGLLLDPSKRGRVPFPSDVTHDGEAIRGWTHFFSLMQPVAQQTIDIQSVPTPIVTSGKQKTQFQESAATHVEFQSGMSIAIAAGEVFEQDETTPIENHHKYERKEPKNPPVFVNPRESQRAMWINEEATQYTKKVESDDKSSSQRNFKCVECKGNVNQIYCESSLGSSGKCHKCVIEQSSDTRHYGCPLCNDNAIESGHNFYTIGRYTFPAHLRKTGKSVHSKFCNAVNELILSRKCYFCNGDVDSQSGICDTCMSTGKYDPVKPPEMEILTCNESGCSRVIRGAKGKIYLTVAQLCAAKGHIMQRNNQENCQKTEAVIPTPTPITQTTKILQNPNTIQTRIDEKQEEVKLLSRMYWKAVGELKALEKQGKTVPMKVASTTGEIEKFTTKTIS